MNKLIVFLSAFICFTSVSRAQWQQTTAPQDAAIRCFLAVGTTIYVGTDGNGILKSTNNGASWTTCNTGLNGSLAVYALAINGPDMYAGTLVGMFKSTNSGANWTTINTGLTNTAILSIVITGSTILAGTDGGLFKSTDNGATWTAAGLAGKHIRSVVLCGNNVYVGCWNNEGIFLSVNGAAWNPDNAGMTNLYIFSLAVNGTKLFVGTGGDGIFTKANGTSNWTSTNNGLLSLDVQSFLVNGNSILVGTGGGGVFRSLDNGVNWAYTNTGLFNMFIYSLGICGTTVYAGSNNSGIFKNSLSGALVVEENESTKKFDIYPNPASNEITICNNELLKDALISIFDIQGKMLLQQILLNEKTQIDISSLVKGFYLVKVCNSNKSIVSKIVKD